VRPFIGKLGIGQLAICILAIVGSPIAAARQPVVVELFTSEGCSSCPPADRLLAEMVQNAPEGVEIIGLSEHVDYWDGLGWRDPFSNKLFTERQDQYARHFGPDKVYTPQMIVDGAAELVGSDRAQLLKALTAAKARAKASVTLGWHGANALDVKVSGAAKSSDVMMAITEDGLSVDVKRGENAGHTLPHVRVTRSLVKIGQTDDTGAITISVPAAAQAGWKGASLRATVFVQTRGLGPITGAASLPFGVPAR
jgi:hypothetical protein